MTSTDGTASSAAPLPDIPVKYDDIRDRVEDGDVILFRGTVLLSRVIERVSHGDYSHCAIAANWEERKMLLQAELVGGVQAVPMSVAVGTYNGRVDWYKIAPAWRAKLDMAMLMAEARANLGLSYARHELVRAAGHFLFGAKLPSDPDNPSALFCSQYVERCFRKAGLPLSKDTDDGTSPAEIAASDVLQFKGTILHDPKVTQDRLRDRIALSASGG